MCLPSTRRLLRFAVFPHRLHVFFVGLSPPFLHSFSRRNVVFGLRPTGVRVSQSCFFSCPLRSPSLLSLRSFLFSWFDSQPDCVSGDGCLSGSPVTMRVDFLVRPACFSPAFFYYLIFVPNPFLFSYLRHPHNLSSRNWVGAAMRCGGQDTPPVLFDELSYKSFRF